MQFLGAIVGDHVKTAICTRIMTGSVLGTGTMIATTAAPPTSVPRFAWLTDDGSRTYQIDKFIEVAKTMMGRRHVQASGAYLDGLRALHEQTLAASASK
jgi:hypothetical protein